MGLDSKEIAAYLLIALAFFGGGIFIIFYSESIFLAIFFSAILIVPAIFITKYCIKEIYKNYEEEQKRREVAEEAKFIRFYKKCKEMNVSKNNNEKNKQKLSAIGETFGFYTFEDAIEAYSYAEEILAKNNKKAGKSKEEERIRQLEKARKQDEEAYYKEQAISCIVGKNKYLDFINKKLEELNTEYDRLNKTDASCLYKERKKDNWGWAGGIAEGLAGPVAGVVAAHLSHEQTNEYNKSVDAYNSSISHIVDGINNLNAQNRANTSSEITKYKNVFEKVQYALVDENTNENFKKLKFNIESRIKNSSKYLALNIKAEAISPIKIFDEDGIIDGSIKINVLNGKNEIVGNAYYNADNIKNYSLSRAGFLNSAKRDIIAIPVGKDCFDKNEEYHYEIHPIAIWIIEREKKEKNK